MKLEQALKSISSADKTAVKQAENKWLNIAKPLFSLGKLEKAIIKIAGMRRNADFKLNKKALVIMCGDNGIVEEGVTQSSQKITRTVAHNFTEGKATVCIMAKTAGVDIFPVDVGMAEDVEGVERHKLSYGTANMTKKSAMTRDEAVYAIETGINKAIELYNCGYDIIATGEMGIGNTATSTAVMCVFLSIEPESITGKGAGLSDSGLERKINAIKKAIAVNKPNKNDVLDVLSKVGGFDIAGITGLFIGGALCGIPVVADGIISSVGAYCAVKLNSCIKDYILGSHISKEPLGRITAEILETEPIIDADMFLGEGSGAVAVLPLIEMGYNVYCGMSTFENWGADEKYRILK